MNKVALAASLSLCPGAALAHNAFGDIGPFYAGLLHPLADPAQGLLLAALAVLLARQRIEVVSASLAMLVGVTAALLVVQAVTELPAPGMFWSGFAAVAVGILALSGLRLPLPVALVIAALVAIAATSAIDPPGGFRSGFLPLTGAFVGISAMTLLCWGAVDLAQQRLGPIANAVAASWIVAIGLMWLAFGLKG